MLHYLCAIMWPAFRDLLRCEMQIAKRRAACALWSPNQVSNPYRFSRPETRSMCGLMAVANGVE